MSLRWVYENIKKDFIWKKLIDQKLCGLKSVEKARDYECVSQMSNTGYIWCSLDIIGN